jgi:histidine triad (HIT) family protein
MKSCIFCKIISLEEQASIVYQDETVIAFMDLHPTNVGHTLVVPKDHWETIYDIPDLLLSDLFIVVKKIAKAVKKSVKAQGINLIQSNEEAALQSINHVHVHVIPRFRGDAMALVLEDLKQERTSRKSLDDTAELIRETLRTL